MTHHTLVQVSNPAYGSVPDTGEENDENDHTHLFDDNNETFDATFWDEVKHKMNTSSSRTQEELLIEIIKTKPDVKTLFANYLQCYHWENVEGLTRSHIGGMDPLTAIRTVRFDRLKTTYEQKPDVDMLIDLVVTKHDEYEEKGDAKKYSSFVRELSELACLVLEEDFARSDPNYLEKEHDVDGSAIKTTILHLAAGRNLTMIMEKILEKKNDLWDSKDEAGNLPLHCATEKFQDDAATLLIRRMPNKRVREILENGRTNSPPLFSKIIKDIRMKKTVGAILDCLIDPHWSFLLPSNKQQEDIVLPNTAVRYRFYYELLDGNKDGTEIHPGCHGEKKSCFHLLVKNSNDKDASLLHPVVRMLMHSKWEQFGKCWIYKGVLYSLLFLLLMSIAFLSESSTPDRRSYSTPMDIGRGVCEAGTFVFVLIYTVLEIEEITQHKKAYWSILNMSNYFDIVSCLLLWVVVPLRFTACTSEEFYVSSAAYLISFVRICYMIRYACKPMSIYTTALYFIIIKEVSRFLVLFGIFMFSFAGFVYLALKGSLTNSLVEKANQNNSLVGKSYVQVILQEVRSLSEGKEFGETDEYLNMNVFVLILIMINMFCGIVVLNNILIGQIGNAYSAALENARIQYDIGRIQLLAYIEDTSSTRALWTTSRRKFYKKDEILTNRQLEKELKEEWSAFKVKTQHKN